MPAPKWYRVRKPGGNWGDWYRSASKAGSDGDGVIFQFDDKEGPGRQYGVSTKGFTFTPPEETQGGEKVFRVRITPEEYRPQKNKFRKLRSEYGMSYVKDTTYEWGGKSGSVEASYKADQEEHLEHVDMTWKGAEDAKEWSEILRLFGIEASRVRTETVTPRKIERSTKWADIAKSNIDRVINHLKRLGLPNALEGHRRREMLEWSEDMDRAEDEKHGIV